MNDAAVELSQALAGAVDGAEASVVRVDAGRRRPSSGTVYSSDGLIVTALHAIERDQEVAVFDGKESVPATLVGADPGTDLAVLRAQRPLGKTPSFVDESTLRRGHLVLAVSRPGRGARAALGVVSAIAGEWRGPRGSRIEHYVQLSLPLEVGYSGSLIVSAAGETVGVGMGGVLRATPLVLTKLTLSRIVAAITTHGSVRRAYLGVNLQPVRLPQALAQSTGQRVALMVFGLEPGGPAEQAGIGLGDVLLEAAGARLSTLEDLFAALEEERIDKPLEVRLLRAGNEQRVDVVARARS